MGEFCCNFPSDGALISADVHIIAMVLLFFIQLQRMFDCSANL